MSILELTERMKELNLRLMEKNRDGAGVAANRIIQQIDALKVVAVFFWANLALHFIFSSMFGISADHRDEELRATHHLDSYRSCNTK